MAVVGVEVEVVALSAVVEEGLADPYSPENPLLEGVGEMLVAGVVVVVSALVGK